ncbi:hypothetical protein ATANTOWER_032185 [Ataeniobius toweri]|uniref:Uncharacterized protein n=1 Tax=Ataeniobius toweri TaxID=208326 RepID=A0ABU7C160_9TELE|nr:hypothetical protein [Ataeniobius toweri]
MKTTLLLLKLRFNYQPDSPLQYLGIGLTREAEECDPPIVETHPPVTLFMKWDHHPGVPVQRHCPQLLAMLKRRVKHDSPTTSRDLRYSGRIPSTPEALLQWSFLTTSFKANQ